MYAREASTLLHKPAKAMHGYKKRGDWLLPVPHTEALRLPCQSERATIDPTPICTSYPYNEDEEHVNIHTHGHLLLQCSMIDILKFLRFRYVKNKASSKRLL